MIVLFLSSALALPCGQNREFIDLGANDGQSLSWFKTNWMQQAGAKRYTGVTAFEMNPVFEPVLQSWLKKLGAAGKCSLRNPEKRLKNYDPIWPKLDNMLV